MPPPQKAENNAILVFPSQEMVLCNLTADSLDTVGNLLAWLLASPNLLGWPTSL